MTTLPRQTESDAALAAIRTGDPAAWETFVRENAPRMLAVARRMLRNDEDAADAVQEAFVSAFRNFGEFESRAQLSTWLHRIVVNACLMHLRKKRRKSVDQLLPSFDETGHFTHPVREWAADPADDAAKADLQATVRQCIDQLPEPYRTTLLLRDIEQFDTEQTAGMMNCSIECVKSRLHRARTALRTILTPVFAGEGN